jgi:hypothetical protein
LLAVLSVTVISFLSESLRQSDSGSALGRDNLREMEDEWAELDDILQLSFVNELTLPTSLPGNLLEDNLFNRTQVLLGDEGFGD